MKIDWCLNFKKDRSPVKIYYFLNFKMGRLLVKINQFQDNMGVY